MLEMILKMLPKEYSEIAQRIITRIKTGSKFLIWFESDRIVIIDVMTEQEFKFPRPEEVEK